MRYKPLGEVIKLSRGFDLPVSQRTPGNVPVIGATGIIGWHGEAKMAGPGVTIGRSGVIGGATWSDIDYWPLNTSMYVEDFGEHDPRFVYYALKSLDFAGYDSGSAQPSLNRNYIAGMPFPSPGVEAERAISGVLSSIDEKILNNKSIVKLSDQLLRASIESMELFMGECSSSVGDVLQVTPKCDMPPPHKDIHFVEMGALSIDGPLIDEVTFRDVPSGSRFQNGDTLFARITPCLENGKTGFVNMLPEGETACGSTEFIVLRARQGDPPLFPYALSRSDRFRAEAQRLMAGTSGRQRVSAKDLSQISIRMPDRIQMREFAVLANIVGPVLGSTRREIRALAELRDALLPGLLDGTLTVRLAEEALSAAV